MMKAKDLIIDFINYVFLLIMISFCILYFTVGDHFSEFGKFLKIILSFSVFGVFFLINLKAQRNLIVKLNEERTLNEIIGYFTEQDGYKDKIILLFLPVVIIAIGFWAGPILFSDFVQALAAFFFTLFWHRILFKAPDTGAKLIILRNIDEIKDRIIIFILPILIVGIGMFEIEINTAVDFIQGGAGFLLMIGWHQILFNDKN